MAHGLYKPNDATDINQSFVVPLGVKVLGGFNNGDSLSQRDSVNEVTVLTGDLEGNDTTSCMLDSQCTSNLCVGGFCMTSSNSQHVVLALGTDLSTVIDGFTITRGRAGTATEGGFEPGGGGIRVGGRLTIRNCVITGNWASNGGGGVYSGLNGCDFLYCDIINNRADHHGGGVGAKGTASPRFINCRVMGNEAGPNGAGLHLESEDPQSQPLIMNCLIAHNHSLWGSGGTVGAGIFAGGDVSSNPMQLTIRNSTIAHNSGLDPQGGSQDSEGGGLAVGTSFGFPGGHAEVYIYNSIIWGNEAELGKQIYNDVNFGGYVQVKYSDIRRTGNNVPNDPHIVGSVNYGTPQEADHVFGTDETNHYPHFINIGAGNFRIERPTSGPPNVCIDSGDNTFIPDVVQDLDGKPRRINDPETADTGNAGTGGCEIADMGAYEFSDDTLVTIEGDGSRYLAVTVSGNAEVALKITGDPTDPDVSCVSGYLTAPQEVEWAPDFGTGNMVSLLGSETPIYLTPTVWNGPFGILHVSGVDIVPGKEYTISAEREFCGGTVSVPSPARTWISGDIDNDDDVDMDDILGFASHFGNCYYNECGNCNPANDCVCDGPMVCHPLAGDQMPCDPTEYLQFYANPQASMDLDDWLVIIYSYSEPDVFPSNCGWPCEGAMAVLAGGEKSEVNGKRGSGAVRLVSRESRVRGAELVTVDVMLEGLSGLRGVQLAMDALGPDGAALELVDLTVDEDRADYVFGGGRAVSAVNRQGGRLVAAAIDGAVESGESAYLGTFVFAGPGMSGPIRMSLRAGDTMFRSAPGVAIDVASASESIVYGE
ncbi:MAG: right-handed parallel beta-helix repeat-containing protein [Planctomycetota bacterium]